MDPFKCEGFDILAISINNFANILILEDQDLFALGVWKDVDVHFLSRLPMRVSEPVPPILENDKTPPEVVQCDRVAYDMIYVPLCYCESYEDCLGMFKLMFEAYKSGVIAFDMRDFIKKDSDEKDSDLVKLKSPPV